MYKKPDTLITESAPITSFEDAAANNARRIRITTYDIHDILRSDGECPVTLNTLQFLVRSQAALHMANVNENQERLKTLLKDHGNTLRGFVLYADGIGPAGYAIYYPMIDGRGSRVAYCEDFFIVESFRKHGVAKILFHELAKRTMEDNAEYLQWATDRRNLPVHGFIQNKLGAKHPDVITIAANDLLDPDTMSEISLTDMWNDKDLITRPLRAEDVNLPGRLGLSPNLIRHTGDLPFKGFVTYERGKGTEPLAITPGWVHLSTFQLRKGLHLEQPVFANDTNRENITLSVINASRRYTDATKLAYFRWHIDQNDPFMTSFLQGRIGLSVDSMIGTRESELIVYTLTNGALLRLAEDVPDRVLSISNSAAIGSPQKLNKQKSMLAQAPLKP